MEIPPIRITLLGTGTSQGVPVIGCSCEVCTSTDPRDQRLRVSALVESPSTTLVIDTGPDFRQQMLRSKVRKLDAVLITHEHNDHIIGLDDVRPFNFMQRKPMLVYGLPRVLDEIRKRFAYIFDEDPYPGAPRLELMPLEAGVAFRIGELEILPVEVMHGALPVLGFRFGEFSYLTDVKTIADDQIELIEGSKTIVLNALHHNPHPTHLNLEEALKMAKRLGASTTVLTHISHRMGRYAQVAPTLPPNVILGYDTMTFQV